MGDQPKSYQGDNFAVTNVTHDDCRIFLQRLEVLSGIRFCLPTEAEWEYAARGGNRSKGYKYAGSNNIDEVAWYKENSTNTSHEVALKKPNELGLYDMSGNVIEWCKDYFGYYLPEDQTNPNASNVDNNINARGGGYWHDASDCRVSKRAGYYPGYGYNDCLGFRLCLKLPFEKVTSNNR